MIRKLFVAILILVTPAYANAAVTGEWDLQDNAASTVIVANVGTNAVLTNAGNTNGLSGNTAPELGTLFTRYLLFPATNDYIVAGSGNGGVIQNTAQATLSCFFLCSDTDTTGSHTLIFISAGAANTRANIQLNSSGQITASGRAGDGDTTQTKTTTNSYDDGTWHHVAAVFDYANDTIIIYVDGTSVAQTGTISFTGTVTSNTASTSVNIASTQSTTSSYGGRIAGVRISNSDDSAILDDIIALKDIPVTGPSITTSATQTMEESTRLVCPLVAPGGTEPYVWTVTGEADAARFSVVDVSGDPWLRREDSDDFENPRDANTDGVAVVEVTCTDDDTETDTLTINVTTTNEGGGINNPLKSPALR